MALSPLTIVPAIAERSSVLSDTRCDDPRGHYELLMPKGFMPVDKPYVLPSQEHSPCQVALFQTTEPPLLELEITGMFLRREIAPADLLERLLHEHIVLETRRVPSRGGDRLEALTRAIGREPYLSRWWTVKDGGAEGGRLFILEGRAAEPHFEAAADTLTTMLASFRLLEPTPWSYFEELRQLGRKAPNDFVCFYPASWRLEVARDEADGFAANLWQLMGGRLMGRIAILSERGELSPDEAIARYEATLNGPVQWADVEDREPFGLLDRAWTRRGRATLEHVVLDLTVHVGRHAGGTVVLALAGLSATIDPLVAATNRRALDLLCETLRVASR